MMNEGFYYLQPNAFQLMQLMFCYMFFQEEHRTVRLTPTAPNLVARLAFYVDSRLTPEL